MEVFGESGCSPTVYDLAEHDAKMISLKSQCLQSLGNKKEQNTEHWLQASIAMANASDTPGRLLIIHTCLFVQQLIAT